MTGDRAVDEGAVYRCVVKHEGIEFRTDWVDNLYDLESAEIAAADFGGWDEKWCEKKEDGEIVEKPFAESFGEVEVPDDR